jgi:hypothetical protein
MKRHSSFLGLIALAAAWTASPVDATQVVYRTPRQLGQDASLVVDGRVASVRSYWNESHSKIITEAVIDVAATHKGAGTSSVRVVQLGGVVGNVRMTVAGAVAWHSGEEVLLFLEPATPGAYQVAGFSQGKYRIERDPRSGKAYVEHVGPGGTELLAAPGDPGAEERSATPRKLALDRFIDDVFGRR